MKFAALALLVALPALAVPATADACAMRKMPVKLMVADTEMQKGENAEEAGRLRAAIRHYERAMNAPGDASTQADAALASARLNEKLGNADRALARLHRAVAIDGSHAGARKTLGAKLLDTNPIEALRHLQAAQNADRFDADLYTDLAVAHARMGQKAAAERNLLTAKGLGADPQKVVAAEKVIAGMAVAAVL